MASPEIIRDVRDKVQRILTRNFGNVRVDEDGDFILTQGSSIIWVRVSDGFGDDGTLVTVSTPLIRKVKFTPALYKWVATEGRMYKIGGIVALPDSEGADTGTLYFDHSIIGDDIDESELLGTVYPIGLTADDLDNELRDMFGGELIGPDE